jgi:ATP-dependent helicase/nuclease subunit B
MQREREIIFDEAFDGSPWPGPLGDAHRSSSSSPTRPAVAGVQWLGPLGLLDHLETALGLAAPPISTGERVASLAARLRVTDGYWSDSFAADPFGTARHLLAERDELWNAGWRGQPAGARLQALATVCRGLPPGLPDRVVAVAARLAERDRDPQLARITLFESTRDLTPCWRQVLEQLAARGVEIAKRPLCAATHATDAPCDLAAARSAPFSPRGDGSLLLLRPHGPLAAAEDIAAWIAQLPERERPLIIGADAVLDQALAAHGVPTTGASGDATATLRVLPLVVALGWQPADPSVAQRLLLLRDCPLPRRLARRLCAALSRWPAVGSELWRSELADGLAAIEDPMQRARATATAQTLFAPSVDTDAAYPLDQLLRRVDCVRSWAQHEAYRVASSGASGASAWRFEAVVEQCRRVERIAALADLDAIPAPDARRIVELASEGLGSSGFSHQAGVDAVDQPDAVCGPASQIVWWSFSRDSVPQPRPLRLSHREREALGEQGARLPDPGAEAIRAARRYARPLMQAQRLLVLVCPEVSSTGDELHLHPLSDELEARCPSAGGPSPLQRLLVGAEELPRPAGRVSTALLPLPAPTRDFHVDAGSVARREVESPSSLETLLGCPLRWTLRYVGKLSGGLGEPLAGDSPRAIGSLAHRLFSMLLGEPLPANADATGAQIGLLFDTEGPRCNAELFLPGRETQRDDLRQRLVAAARALHGHLRDAGARVASSEKDYSQPGFEATLRGIPDLVVERPPAVIDFKWGGRGHHRDALAAGTALQLAAYSQLASADASSVPVGYFILRQPELLASPGHPFPNATTVSGPALAETWRGARAAHRETWAALDAGHVVAAGNAAADNAAAGGVTEVADEHGAGVVEKSALDEQQLRLKAPCTYCDYGLLCGRACEVGA